MSVSIGINAYYQPVKSDRPAFTLLPHELCRLIEMSGGASVILPITVDTAALAAQLTGLQGVVLVGGSDYDLEYFGRRNSQYARLGSDLRCRYDIALARAAISARLPILGIGGGMQLLNLMAGGTLVDQLPAGNGVRHCDPDGYVRHQIAITAGSVLERIYGGLEEVRVNSRHRRAVDRVGQGLKVAARSPDGSVEAIESDSGAWCVGVQWHPGLPYSSRIDGRIFELLVDHCDQPASVESECIAFPARLDRRKPEEILELPIADAGFSVRVANALERSRNVLLVGELAAMPDDALKSIANFGATLVAEVDSQLARLGIRRAA